MPILGALVFDSGIGPVAAIHEALRPRRRTSTLSVVVWKHAEFLGPYWHRYVVESTLGLPPADSRDKSKLHSVG